MPQIYFPPQNAQERRHRAASGLGRVVGRGLGRAAFDTQEEKQERLDIQERRARIDAIEEGAIARRETNEQVESARAAAVDVTRRRLDAMARRDPTLRNTYHGIVKDGLALPPEQRMQFWESKGPGLLELGMQGQREQLADELLEGIRLGHFGDPGQGASMAGPPAPGQQEQQDPLIAAVQRQIDMLRNGTGDPDQVRQSVDSLRREESKRRNRQRMFEMSLKRGSDLLTSYEQSGIAPTNPTYMRVALAVDQFSTGEIDADRYIDLLTEAQTGRKSGASPMDPDQIWRDSYAVVEKQLQDSGMFPTDEGYQEQLDKLSELRFTKLTGGTRAMQALAGAQQGAAQAGGAEEPAQPAEGLRPWGESGAAQQQLQDAFVDMVVSGRGTRANFQAKAEALGVDMASIPEETWAAVEEAALAKDASISERVDPDREARERRNRAMVDPTKEDVVTPGDRTRVREGRAAAEDRAENTERGREASRAREAHATFQASGPPSTVEKVGGNDYRLGPASMARAVGELRVAGAGQQADEIVRWGLGHPEGSEIRRVAEKLSRGMRGEDWLKPLESIWSGEAAFRKAYAAEARAAGQLPRYGVPDAPTALPAPQ